MALATWWIYDPAPHLPGRLRFHGRPAADDAGLARLNRLPLTEVRARRAAGHRPYLGYLDDQPVAYGWVATHTASIGELGLTFSMPARERYLWDFATLPEWQGRGLYPRLLRDLVEREALTADRFWIIHAPENQPSGAGMRKAGFQPVGRLSFQADGCVGLAPLDGPAGASERAQAGARLLGVPLVRADLAPCWACAGVSGSPAACWPPPQPDLARVCPCALETRPAVQAY